MQKVTRRLVLGAAAVMLAAAPAAAQQYPSKSIRLLVPFAAGSITDLLSRVIGQALSQSIGQTVVIENKPGADGSIAALELKRQAPDGHTIMMATNSPIAVVPHLHKAPPYDALADFTPITFVGRSTFFIVVHPAIPAKTLPELIAHAKANPKKVNYASGNTTAIVTTALLATRSGIDMLHVPYKSEPLAINDLLSGQVHLMIAASTTVLPHIQDGKLRALATILDQRSPLLPDVPSIVEAGQPKFPIGPWGAVVGPANMPKEVVARLNKEIVAILNRPDIKEIFLRSGFAAEGSTPEALAAYFKDQLEVWGKTLKQAGIEPQ